MLFQICTAKDERLRYVKQLKVRAGAFRYDSDNVIVYEIEKADGFTHFEFKEYSTEREHLREQKETETLNRVENIIQLFQQGKSYREIAQEVGLSKSMVAKIIKQAASSTKDTAADGVDTVDKVDSGGQELFTPKNDE